MKRLAFAVVALLVAAPIPPALALDEPSQPDTAVRVAPESVSMATYHGRTIDLRQGWAGAQACYTDAQAATTCFDSEREMDQYIASTTGVATSGFRRAAFTDCSSTVRLYDNISYGTPVLGLALRFTAINLSAYSFDNATTSYKIGACSAAFYQGSGATGAIYPGNTAAGAQSPNMVTGWNNTISSIYIG